MGRILGSIKSLLRRTPEAGEQAAPRFVVSVPARLLLSITHAGRSDGVGRGKIIGSTLNISASGLAVVIPLLYESNRPISEDTELEITLDLHPLGTVEMTGSVVRVEATEEGERPGHLLSVKITGMSEGGRALYLQYIGTAGWERVLSGNDKI